MTVFPSANEKLITSVILAACVGFGAGALAVAKGIDSAAVFGAALTLVGAFVGAWVAFSLEAETRRRVTRSQQLEAANKLLYALYERMNLLGLFQYDFIRPVRNSPGRMFEMQPVGHFRSPESRLDINDMAFLFQSGHKPLLLTLNIAEAQFQEAAAAIRMRSDLHLNTVQPLLERAGVVQGIEITGAQIREAIGDRNYHMLRDSTEVVIAQVDKFLERGDELRKGLVQAFTEEFSANEIFNFEMADAPKGTPAGKEARN